jgi:DNA gyrase subunit A
MKNYDMKNIIETSFTQYAGAVLQSRALVDVRDCLKPSARQIFYCLYTDKFLHSKPFKKTLKGIGSAMRMYIHGDSSCEGVIMRAAQPFAMRYPLIEVEGSYGNLMESGNWAAPRYTSSRLTKMSETLFADIQKNTISEWRDNYDDTEQYPTVLASKGYYNIVNGTMGIGVGAASSIPQFNLKEVNESLIHLLWNPDCSFEDIYCAPDFATGATLLNENQIKESLKNGTGFACKLRSVIEYDTKERCLVVKEIPYGVYTNTICGELEKILLDEENPGIDRFNDLTGENPLIKIYLTKTARPERIIKYLYKNTSLQSHYGINMTMLKDGRYPKVFGWKEALEEHLKHERDVYTRAFEYDLKKIKDRLHIIEGLLKAIDVIDEVIATIKSSTSTAAANAALQKLLDIDEIQAKAILDIKLSRLAKLEIKKLINEKEELEAEAERIQAILDSEELLKKEIEKGLREVADKFGDERRTQILNIEKENEEPVEVKSLIVNLTNQNNIFIEETSSLYTTRRGSVGTKFKLDKNEYVTSCCNIQTTDSLLFFSDDGLYYSMTAADLPYEKKSAIESFLPVKNSSKVTSMVALNKNTENEFVIFFTKNGLLKKTKLSEYNTKRSAGIKALELDKDDSIVSIIFTNMDRVGMLTAKGQFLICETKDVRAIGRTSKGVKGIKLNDGDYVTAAKAIPNSYTSIISITQNGLIKQSPKEEFTINGRYTKGSKIHKIDEDIVVDFLPISSEKEIIVCSTKTQVKILVSEIPVLSKQAAGVKSVKLKDNQNIVNLAAV